MPALNEDANIDWCEERAESYFGEVDYLDQTVNTKNKFEWTCEYKHRPWKCEINNMKSKDTWCPICTKGISEKYVGYALNQLFGEQYLFLTKQLECLHDIENMNCDLVNEELGIYIEVMGWATHGDSKDPHLMKLSASGNTGGDAEKMKEDCDRRDRIKLEKMTEAGLRLTYISHSKYEGFDIIGERIYNILEEYYRDKFVISMAELLDNLPNKAEVARHYHNRRKREVVNELRYKGCRLHTFEFTGRKDANITVYCSRCDEHTKKWSFDDIMRRDASARRLLCDICCPTTRRTTTNFEEICQRHNLTYIKHYKKPKAHSQTIVFTCKNNKQNESYIEGLLKENYRCKCGKC